MSRVFLVRHGEVEGNSGERLLFAGWKDLPLTERGQRQAQAVAQRLERERLSAVYSSDLQRARCTAEAIAARHNLPVQAEHGLREVNYGAWAGLGEAEILAGWADLWAQRKADAERVAPPGGESYGDLWRRLQPVWETTVARHREDGSESGDVVLVGHNGSVRILLCFLLGIPIANYRRIRINNCGLTCVEFGADGSPVARFINETCHLEGV